MLIEFTLTMFIAAGISQEENNFPSKYVIAIILGNINNKYNLAIRLIVLKSHYESLTRKGPKTLLLMAIIVQLQVTLIIVTN